MTGNRIALIKELAEQRCRMRGLDGLETRVFIKSLSTLKCMGLAEGTIVTVVEAVVRGRIKGIPLQAILINQEQLRRLSGENQTKFDLIIQNISEHEIIGPVASYLEYRLGIEESGYDKANLSPTEILWLVTPAYQEISRWFSIDQAQKIDSNINYKKDRLNNQKDQVGNDIEPTSSSSLKYFIALVLCISFIVLSIIWFNSTKGSKQATAVSQVEQIQPSEVTSQSDGVENLSTEGNLELPVAPSAPTGQLAQADILLSQDEVMSLKMACVNAQMQGPATYNQCVQSQIAQLQNAPRAPDYSSLNSDEQMSLKMACVNAQMQGPAAFNQCVQSQMRSIGRY